MASNLVGGNREISPIESVFWGHITSIRIGPASSAAPTSAFSFCDIAAVLKATRGRRTLKMA